MKYRLKAPFTFTFGWGQVNSASNRATAPKGTAVIEATNLPDGGYWLAPEKLEVSVEWLEQPVDHRVESLDSWIDCYGIHIPAEDAAEFVESYEEADLYLDYVNNYMSVEGFASWNGLTREAALAVIEKGREAHEARVSGGQA